MSRAQMARLFISQRLSAAAEDIFRLFEEIVTEYEEQIYLQRKKLNGPADSHQEADQLQLPTVFKEEVPPEEQERNPILILGEEPELPQIKEEQEEQFDHQEEAGDLKLTLILEKHESDSEIPVSTELHAARGEDGKLVALPSTSIERMKTEPDEQDYGVSGPTSVLNLTTDLDPVADVQFLNSDEMDLDDRTSSLKETTQPHLGLHALNPGQIIGVQLWANRNSFQRPSEMPHELESLDHDHSSLSCKVCQESFLNKRALIYHVRAHSRDCGLCGKHLDPRESLEVHISMHKKCSFCGKRFISITHLERHMRTHTGERPFSCPVCGKCFAQKATMTKHIVSHTGVKPFGCMHCAKVFSKKESLQKHMRIHASEISNDCSS